MVGNLIGAVIQHIGIVDAMLRGGGNVHAVSAGGIFGNDLAFGHLLDQLACDVGVLKNHRICIRGNFGDFMRIAQLIVVDIRVDLLQNPQLIVDIFILTVGDDDLKLAHDKSPLSKILPLF